MQHCKNMNTNDEANAHRDYARRKAAEEFNEVVRKNTGGWDDLPMTDDQRAYADDAILRAAREFHSKTNAGYDWP